MMFKRAIILAIATTASKATSSSIEMDSVVTTDNAGLRGVDYSHETRAEKIEDQGHRGLAAPMKSKEYGLFEECKSGPGCSNGFRAVEFPWCVETVPGTSLPNQIAGKDIGFAKSYKLVRWAGTFKNEACQTRANIGADCTLVIELAGGKRVYDCDNKK